MTTSKNYLIQSKSDTPLNFSNKTNTMNLGSVIKDIRKQKGQTQTEFASSCGITQTYLSQIENNTKEPNLSTLKEISSKLDIPLPILFFMSLNDDDIAPEKRKAFEIINPSVKSLINEFFRVSK
ncbi:helix-turn-helix domain-containing protein [Flavobacterium nitrogenifigens]|uniref:Helix-turn-helix n=1 Tax=Flavobacterium nitrogenifigens TaxID=1617283 RepID=A0A521B6D7_9FLAO|nr:helix-turn-helix transcriptional regulator [Flavobacterium nitrogenifigens]KAF2334558.1 helix-turn-helix transcriptional regulator [Flavobacterium nitrogenifigens]SMO42625.1 Helix-turn-helix [Flavobacterium nitrogenifigens]